MDNQNDPKIPGKDAAMSGFSTASKSMQHFASEMQRMTSETIDRTSQLMEKLRGAKTMDDVVSIQTNFMQQSFTSYADYTRKFSELMMGLPVEMAKHGREAFEQGTKAVEKAAEQANAKLQQAGEQFKQHQG